MSQLVRTFDLGVNTQTGSQFVDLVCFFTDLIPYPGRWWHWHTSALFQTWSPILEDNGTDTRQPCSSVLGGSDTDTRQTWSPDAGIVHSNFSSTSLIWLIFCADVFTQNRRRDCLSEWKWSPSKLTKLLRVEKTLVLAVAEMATASRLSGSNFWSVLATRLENTI